MTLIYFIVRNNRFKIVAEYGNLTVPKLRDFLTHPEKTITLLPT